MKQDNTKFYIIGGVALLAYFGLIRPILRKTGVVTSPQATKLNNLQKAPVTQNYFSPYYYDNVFQTITGAIKVPNSAKLNFLYNQLDKAFGYVYDDEDSIKGVFASLPTKMEVGALSKYVYKTKGTDLLTWLKIGKNKTTQNGLSTDEIANIVDLIDAKPLYRR